MRPVALAALALALTGCPDQVGSQCPPATTSVGQYALALTGVADAGTACVATTTSDGGATVTTPLTLADAGTLSGAICVGQASDGGAQLYLAIAGKGARPSDLLADGGFHFGAHTDPTTGTLCVCAVGIDETFDGNFTGAWDGGFPQGADGGLPFITGLSGTLTDRLSSSDNGCTCNLPCSVTYAVRGTRF